MRIELVPAKPRARVANSVWPWVILAVVQVFLAGSPLHGAPGCADRALAGSQDHPRSDDRDRAITLARQGRYDEALLILRRLHAGAPGDLPLRADLAVVLAWAGEDEEALLVGERLPFRELEPFIAEALGRSARNLGRPDFAASLYSIALELDSTRIESHIGLTLAILEQGDVAASERQLRHAFEAFPDHPELLLAAGHVLRSAGRPLDAALIYREAGAAGVDRAEASSLEVLSLVDAGAMLLAAKRMLEVWELLDGGQRNRVLAGLGARYVQWSVAPAQTRHPDARYEAVDRALAQLDWILALSEPAGHAYHQLRFDRLLALHARNLGAEIVAELAALEAEGVEIPPYVQHVAGDAFLSLRQPREAERRYRAALEGWPGRAEPTIGLFYALLQQERHAEAREVIAALVRDQPERKYAEGLKESLPNEDRLAAVIAYHLGQAFAGDLRSAERALYELSGRAPLNLSLRQELAWVYRWRGWPRRALDETAGILALEPYHVGARILGAAALLDLGDRPAARAKLDTLMVLAPDNKEAQRTTERFRVGGLWELAVEGRGGRSTGGDMGTRDDMVETRLTAPPIGDRLFLVGRWRRSSASFPGIVGEHDRVAAGAEWRRRGILLSGEVSADRQALGRIAGGGRIEVRPTDHWTLNIRGSSYAHEVPLQADPGSVTGWTAGAALGHRANERRWWIVDAAHLRLSDGNRRWSAYSSVDQELFRRPLGRLAGRAELYGAQNSLRGAPYFNPAHIVTLSTTLQWDWVLWRAYEKSMTQRVRGTGAQLLQKGFGRSTTYSAEYAHVLTLSERFDLAYGVYYGRPVFDGRQERRTALHASLTWRLPW